MNYYRHKALRAKYGRKSGTFNEADHPRAEDGKFGPGGGREQPDPVPPQVPPSRAKPKSEKPAASSWHGRAKPADVLVPGSPLRQKIDQEIAAVRKDLGVPEGNSYGYCDAATVALWDKLGQPKDLVPTSVGVNGEDHFILLDKKNGLVVDPTGDQFNLPPVARAEGQYEEPLDMAPVELEHARDMAGDMRETAKRSQGTS